MALPPRECRHQQVRRDFQLCRVGLFCDITKFSLEVALNEALAPILHM